MRIDPPGFQRCSNRKTTLDGIVGAGKDANANSVLLPYRQALRYIIRNTTLAPRVRAEAQLQLTQMHAYTRPTQIRNRCIIGGQARGVLSDFKMTRVCVAAASPGKDGN